MQIQIVSDTHVEFWDQKEKFNFIKPAAPILALLGDIGCCGDDADFARYKMFINELLPHYEHILIITGNHEYYYNGARPTAANTMDAVDARIREFCKTSRKLHFLNNTGAKIVVGAKTYHFVGTTLWSWIPDEIKDKVKERMSDYSHIYVSAARTASPDRTAVRRLEPADVSAMFVRNAKYLKAQIIKAKKARHNLIILTHHKPYISLTKRPMWLNSAYESNLKMLITPPVSLWAYGHTHIRDKCTIHGVKVYSNPRGYPYEKTNFNNCETISL
jgi:predicted phosphodiesterase